MCACRTTISSPLHRSLLLEIFMTRIGTSATFIEVRMNRQFILLRMPSMSCYTGTRWLSVEANFKMYCYLEQASHADIFLPLDGAFLSVQRDYKQAMLFCSSGKCSSEAEGEFTCSCICCIRHFGHVNHHILSWSMWTIHECSHLQPCVDSISRDDKGQLLLGIRRANRLQTMMPSSVLSSDSMHIGILAAASHAAQTSSRFTIFYNPRCVLAFALVLVSYVLEMVLIIKRRMCRLLFSNPILRDFKSIW